MVLAARAFLTDTPAEVMQLPVQDVADSKEQMILRAVCDERISVPVESLQQFLEVYKALMDRIGGPGALAEVKANWRCNTKQWWVGAVPDSVAPSIYRKLGYTNDMIKLMGLDPSAPGCRTGADGPDIRPRGGEGDEAQRRRLSPEPQFPRALIWRGRDGSPQGRSLAGGRSPPASGS